ncbi:MAG: type I-E CRISPR-associated protein Cas5/CasD [Thermaurantiacus sp.]
MAEPRWLHLLLEAPLMAFGGVRIDQFNPTRDFPAASMLTGLIGNALGWHRSDGPAHQALQDRLVFAARREQEPAGSLLIDMQNAKLEKNDRGWTRSGQPEGRDGASYGAPHRRARHYHMDTSLRVLFRLDPADAPPDLETIAAAFERPARPLFLGRKPCLPAARLLQGWIDAPDAHAALVAAAPVARRLRALWPADSGPKDGDAVDRVVQLADLRNWRSGLHAGGRAVVEGWLLPPEAAA